MLSNLLRSIKSGLLPLYLLFFLIPTIGFCQAPIIESFSPEKGAPGTVVNVAGKNFNSSVDKNVVYFSGVKVQLKAATETQLSFIIPPTGGTGSFNILNTVTGLSVKSSKYFISTYPREDKMFASDFDIETSRNGGSANSAISAGDLDGDGRKDLVYVNLGSNILYICPNMGRTELLNNNSFTTTISLQTKSGSENVAIADMDGDGKQDIIVLESGLISIYKNNLTSGFRADAFTRVEIPLGQSGGKLAIGDMDGDGKPDIVLGFLNLQIYKNECSPNQILPASFSNITTIPAFGSFNRITIEDMNNDGRPEIIAGGNSNSFVSIFSNQVINNILSSTSFPITKLEVGSSSMLAIGDVDQDGLKDLITISGTTKYLNVYKQNSGSTNFTNSSLQLISKHYIGADPKDVLANDIDGDGRVDFVTVSKSDNRVSVFKNDFSFSVANNSWFKIITLYQFAQTPYALLAEDLNNDGIPDLISLNADNTITFRKNKESLIPTIKSVEPLIVSMGATVTIQGNNFGKSANDNLVLVGGKKVQILSASATQLKIKIPTGAASAIVSVQNKVSRRTARFSQPFRYIYEKAVPISAADYRFAIRMDRPGEGTNKLKFIDFDNDGFPDMASVDFKQNLTILRNSASGALDCSTFAEKMVLTSNSKGDATYEDLDDDGLVDILVAGDSETQYFKNISTPGKIMFNPPVGIPLTGGLGADIDGDGKIDFFPMRNVTTENSTRPTFVKVSSKQANMIDITNDGKPELHLSEGSIYKIYKNYCQPGMVSDSLFVHVPALSPPINVRYQDLNNDGLPDMIYGEYYYRNNSLGTDVNFGQQQTLTGYPVNKSYTFNTSFLDYADFNGDGLEDAIRGRNGFSAANQDTLYVYQNLMSGVQDPVYQDYVKFNARNENPGDNIIATPGLEGFIDLNNDGKADIVLRTFQNNYLVIFENTTHPETDTPPVISSFAPAKGTIKSKLLIKGNHFNPVLEKNMIYFGDVRARLLSGSSSELVVEVPPGAVYSFISVLDIETKLRATTTQYFSVQSGDGKGTDFDSSAFKLQENYVNNPGSSGLAAVDLDNDGIPEVIIGETRNTSKLKIFKAASRDETSLPKNFVSAKEMETNKNGSLVQIADLDGDGKPEILALSSTILIFENACTKDCSLSFLSDILDEETRFYRFFLADINQDGKIDIIAPDVGSALRIYLNNSKRGSISFDPYTRVVLDIDASYSSNLGYELADLDNDGMIDLMVSGSNGTKRLCIFRNTSTPGANTISFANPFYRAVPSYVGHISARDFDGDSKTDLIVSQYNSIIFMRNISTRGNIGFAESKTIVNNLAVRFIESADFDGDGKPDLALAGEDESKPAIYLFRNIAAPGILDESSFNKPITVTLPNMFRVAAVTDFNLDGRADLLLAPYTNISNLVSPAILINQLGALDLELATSPGFSSYTSRLTAVALDPEIKIISKGNDIMSSCNVVIDEGLHSADILSFKNDGGMGNIAGTYDSVNGALVLSSAGNSASVTEWQNALRKVNYSNTVNLSGDRTIIFSATLSSGKVSHATRLLQITALPVPVITGFTPKIATKDMEITISGSNFDHLQSITFGNVAAKSFTATSTEIKTFPGEGATGTVSVSTLAGLVAMDGFIYVPTPVISADGPIVFSQGGSVMLSTNIQKGIDKKWMRDGVVIDGASDDHFKVTSPGSYRLQISDHGLSVLSNPIVVETIFTLPSSNFMIATTSLSCRGSKNGTLKITAATNLNYVATLNVNGIASIHKFSTILELPNLEAGNYNLCITIPDQPNYKQCYDVVISEPKELSIYTNISTTSPTVTISLSGANTYFVDLNGKTYQTTNSELKLPLASGINKLMVSSDLPCQGVIKKTLAMAAKASFSPNPVEKILTIGMGDNTSPEADIELFSLGGQRVFRAKRANEGYIEIDIEHLIPGMYVIKISTATGTITSKILKK
ncbi:FG-GAP-like repeat-containing protein [Pedobacter sp. BMA]|uniref:FG-GAP-like repeat-containing protein n=1 Tax=Pedobacter sp. BMA TaxID=1663685 RepID=UPI00064AC671|nr:FG-GAP-like repeat-containing protein [Pedobacter sp. BMA]KLT64046.1 hypothetical protein AB669_18450 [Pedobacter sp. BMA]